MKGLTLFGRTNSKGTWTIAAFHSPHSLTWRWLLSFSLFRGDESRLWPLWAPYRANGGLQWVLRLPFLGMLRWSQQRPMWYRDLFMRVRDEQDRLRPKDGVPPQAPPPVPAVLVDGGNSLH